MNALDVLKYGNLTVLRTIEGLPHSEWDTPDVCGVWSVKEIIAHLASFEDILVDVLNTFLDGGSTATLEKWRADPLAFNDDEVALRQDKTPEEVVEEYRATQAKTMELAARISPETFRQNGTLPWYGMEYDLDDFIAYSFYGHKREHTAQINVFRDQLAQQQLTAGVP